MDFLKELLLSSAVMQGALATGLGATVCYLYLTSQPVPEALMVAFGVVLGFYFRTKGTVEGVKSALNK